MFHDEILVIGHFSQEDNFKFPNQTREFYCLGTPYMAAVMSCENAHARVLCLHID